jgi:hypothetical protein
MYIVYIFCLLELQRVVCISQLLLDQQVTNTRFGFLMVVVMSVLVLRVVTPCGFVGRYQCFAGTYCLHLQCPEEAKLSYVQLRVHLQVSFLNSVIIFFFLLAERDNIGTQSCWN